MSIFCIFLNEKTNKDDKIKMIPPVLRHRSKLFWFTYAPFNYKKTNNYLVKNYFLFYIEWLDMIPKAPWMQNFFAHCLGLDAS